MSNCKSIYKGAKINEAVSTVPSCKAGLQGVSVNGTKLTLDAETIK